MPPGKITMKVKITQEKIAFAEDKYQEFYKGDIADLDDELANDLILMGAAEIYQQSAVKIRGKHRLHKASVK